jgi:hypothetical protein
MKRWLLQRGHTQRCWGLGTGFDKSQKVKPVEKRNILGHKIVLVKKLFLDHENLFVCHWGYGGWNAINSTAWNQSLYHFCTIFNEKEIFFINMLSSCWLHFQIHVCIVGCPIFFICFVFPS